MGVKKQLQGHGDPLLMEVVAGLEEMITSNHNEKQSGGVRGVGERTFSQGASSFSESMREFILIIFVCRSSKTLNTYAAH